MLSRAARPALRAGAAAVRYVHPKRLRAAIFRTRRAHLDIVPNTY
jgi:hypothetical protein